MKKDKKHILIKPDMPIRKELALNMAEKKKKDKPKPNIYYAQP